jgi:hypothetical protein
MGPSGWRRFWADEEDLSQRGDCKIEWECTNVQTAAAIGFNLPNPVVFFRTSGYTEIGE